MKTEQKFFGIEDSEFIRDKVPMTKEEIRILSLAKMKLTNNSKVLDIGAGTGSVSIESALFAFNGRVTACEKNEKAVELIKQNCKKFEIENLEIIKGTAPGCINSDEKYDAIFIGGSSGNMDSILELSKNLLKEKSRIVINATLIETFISALKELNKKDFKNIDYMQVQINRSKKLGTGNSLEPVNPIFIIWGEK